MRKLIALALISVALTGSGAIAQQKSRSMCTERVEISIDQAREMIEKLRQENGDLIERSFAFETLACSNRDSLRQSALNAALSDKEPGLKAAALLEIVMLRETLIVEIEPGQDLGREGAKWIAETGGSRRFTLTEHNRLTGSACTDCCPCYQNRVDVSGTRLNIVGYTNQNRDSERGEFVLSDNGLMEGFYYVPGVQKRMKSTIKLF